MRNRAAVVVGLCLFANAAAAAVPSEFTVQGVLRDSGGVLQSMPVTIAVEFYDDQTVGAKIGATYTQASVPVSSGLFTQTFTLSGGDVTALGAAANVWMKVTAGTDVFPRQKVTPELYALFAKVAESLSSACSGCVDNSMVATGISGSKISGAVGSATTASQIQGNAVQSGVPSNGQALVWTGGTQYTPTNVVTSITASGGLTSTPANPILGAGTMSIATVIPDEHYMVRVHVGAPSPAPATNATNLAPFTVGPAVAAPYGNTTAIFGSLRPISIVQDEATIGFNTYFNGAWRTLTPSPAATTMALIGNGDGLHFDTGIPGTTTGAVISATATGLPGTYSEKMRLFGNGTLAIDRSGTNTGVINQSTVAGAGLTFGTNSGEGIASKRNVGGNQFGLDFYSNFTTRMSIANNGEILIPGGGTGHVRFNDAGIAPPAAGSAGWKIETWSDPFPYYGIGVDFGTQWYVSNGQNNAAQAANGGTANVPIGGHVFYQSEGTPSFTTVAQITRRGDLRIGHHDYVTTGGAATPGYGAALVFSGGPKMNNAFDVDNSDPLWMARFNAAGDDTELRVSLGDDTAGKFMIGYTTGNSGSFQSPPTSANWVTGATFTGSGNLTIAGVGAQPGGGSWAVASDARLKNIKGAFTRGLREVMALEPIRYEYKPDNALGIRTRGEFTGFIAQAVEKLIPEAVKLDDKGYRQITNDPILWTILNAVKEVATQVRDLQAQNRALAESQRRADAENKMLRERLAKLEGAVGEILAAREKPARTKIAHK